jgi:hypothetical protein
MQGISGAVRAKQRGVLEVTVVPPSSGYVHSMSHRETIYIFTLLRRTYMAINVHEMTMKYDV